MVCLPSGPLFDSRSRVCTVRSLNPFTVCPDATVSEADPRNPRGVSPELARWVEGLAAFGEEQPARIRLLREAWGQRDSLTAGDLFALSDLVLDELLCLLETQGVRVERRVLLWPQFANPGEAPPGTVCPVFVRLAADRTGPEGGGRADDARVRLGEQVQARYGAEVIFSPHTLGRGVASVGRDETRARPSKLFVDFDTAFGLVRPLRNFALLHELRHLAIGARLASRRPDPFHGFFRIIKGRLAGEANPEVPCYGPTLYFEECETCRDMIRQRATRFLGRLAWAKGLEEKQTAAERLMMDFELGYFVTDQVHCGIRHVIRHLRTHPDDGVLYRDGADGILRATVKGVPTGDGVIEAELPLIRADSQATPAEKRKQLELQLAFVYAVASNFCSSYIRVMGNLPTTQPLRTLVDEDPALLRNFAKAVRTAFHRVRY